VNARTGSGEQPGSDPLARAADRLAKAIEGFESSIAQYGSSTMWERLGLSPDAPVAVTTISAEDVRFSVPETDVNELHRNAEDAGIFASAYARPEEQAALRAPRPPKTLPQLPLREISVRSSLKTREDVNADIAKLERATVPHASAIEAYRGEVAAVFDASAEVLERAVKG